MGPSKDGNLGSLEALRTRIQTAFNEIRCDTGLFIKVWRHLLHRCETVVQKQGDHIEPLSKKTQAQA